MDLDQMSFSLYQPLLVIAAVAALLAVVGRTIGARGNPEGREKVLDISFAVTLLGGVYVVVLLVLTIFDEPDLVYDAVVVILMFVAFFALVLSVGFVLFELIGSRLGRTRAPRRSE